MIFGDQPAACKGEASIPLTLPPPAAGKRRRLDSRQMPNETARCTAVLPRPGEIGYGVITRPRRRPPRERGNSLRLPVSLFAAVFLLAAGEARAQAPAYILVDVGAGTVIGQRDANKLWFPASVTKLMTAYLAFEAMKTGRLKPTSPVTVSANALAEPPSKMGYKVGTVMNLDNALKMMIVKSANDIAVAIAETVGGSEARFVAA